MIQDVLYPGRRLSYDGALCTVRCVADSIPGTKGEWLGVEWDNPERGKHNGTHDGLKYFDCKSSHSTAASFVRPSRKYEAERTVLEAIKFKYVGDSSQFKPDDAVVISGKVAQEIGFDKIVKEQSVLQHLKIVILDGLLVHGIAPRGSSIEVIEQARAELAETCPNVVEIDLSYNPIETWADVEHICTALPKLRVLKLNGIRLRDLDSQIGRPFESVFGKVEELHLNECLLEPSEVLQVLGDPSSPRFRSLKSLWLSQNELSDFHLSQLPFTSTFDTIKTLVLEKNLFKSLDPLVTVLQLFPSLSRVSLRENQITSFGTSLAESKREHRTLQTLDVSQNDITSFTFIDLLSPAFSSLSSLRISRNPVYDHTQQTTGAASSTGAPYYLTLARVPTLKTLNYTEITPREREEGEIYYLSTAEKEIRTALAATAPEDTATATKTITDLRSKYPRYDPLCEKYDRDNLIHQFSTQPATDNPRSDTLFTNLRTPSHPPGSLLSRLVSTTFYIPASHLPPITARQKPARPVPSTAPPHHTFTRSIPNTTPTTSVFALVSRALDLQPLGFRLVYESEELDPSLEDTTTRSQIYGDAAAAAAARKNKSGRTSRFDEWGDWDADEIVERRRRRGDDSGDGDGDGDGRWTDDGGVWIKDGKKWVKREVEVLFGMRSWGDWLDRGARACRVRVEPVVRAKRAGSVVI